MASGATASHSAAMPEEEREEHERQRRQPDVPEDRHAEHPAEGGGEDERAARGERELEQQDRGREQAVEDLPVDVNVVPDRGTDARSSGARRQPGPGDSQRLPISKTSSAVATATQDLRAADDGQLRPNVA